MNIPSNSCFSTAATVQSADTPDNENKRPPMAGRQGADKFPSHNKQQNSKSPTTTSVGSPGLGGPDKENQNHPQDKVRTGKWTDREHRRGGLAATALM